MADPADQREALKSYIDLAKQQITLGVGLLGLSTTFIDTFLSSTTALELRVLLVMGWSLLLVSVLCGLLFHGRAIVLLAESSFDVDDSLLNWMGRIQQTLFISGVIALIVFVALPILNPPATIETNSGK